MNNDLIKGLKKASEFDFLHLKHCIDIASNAKNYIKATGITRKEFGIRMRKHIKKFNTKAYLGGYYNYSMRDIAVLEALWSEYYNKIAEEDHVLKFKSKKK